MANGTGPLWKGMFKINAKGHGFVFTFKMAEIDEATAIVRANIIASHLKYTLPASASIFFAAISRDNPKKDSRFLKDALGVGLHPGVGTPAVSDFDFSKTALLVRFEDEDGGVTPRKFCPLPDEVIAGGATAATITPAQIPITLPLAAAGSGADWYANFALLLKALVVYTHRVVADHESGGPYTYFTYTAAFPMRVAVKKGARAFV